MVVNPGAGLDNEVFWKTFQECAGKLPKNVSAVFCLREMDGVESKEICAQLDISESNLWVMLHRARMALRRCLETNWFAKQGMADMRSADNKIRKDSDRPPTNGYRYNASRQGALGKVAGNV